jgi:hypothetical protein
MNEYCPHCKVSRQIYIELAKDSFELIAYCGECDQLLDPFDYLETWEIKGYLERGCKIHIPQSVQKRRDRE